MTKILIQNYGEYQVPNEKINELLAWLAAANSVRTVSVQEQQNKDQMAARFPGKDLING